ncbi:lytic transglycosylase, partial [Burkholderia multivorans]|nr:lytic transglycosylase [Burkholderia multivorans]
TGQAPAPASKPAVGATPAKRAASTDALWYLNTGSPSAPAANTAAAAAVTTPSAVTSSAAPAAAAPQQPAAPSPRSRASADALWYISQ